MDAIVKELIGSKKIRLGSITPENDKWLTSCVTDYTTNQRPIRLLVMYGARKAYGVLDRKCADLADLLALRRLTLLQKAVKKIYPPGLVFRVVHEDLTEFVLTDKWLWSVVFAQMKCYHNSLASLVKTFGLSFIDVVKESSLLARINTTPAAFISRAQENAALLLDYIMTRCPKAYCALESVGWSGRIPDEQWAWYMARASTEQPNADSFKRAKSVCLYFGTSLARKQFGTLSLPTSEPRQIKASLCVFPPGVPKEMYNGRIEYKIKDEKNSNNTTPPWAGVGVFRTDGDITVLPVKAVRTTPTKASRLKLGNTAISADILCENCEISLHTMALIQAKTQEIIEELKC